MKVAFCMSQNYLETGGGGRIQILKTKEYLEKLVKEDFQICIIHNPEEIDNTFDICHIFNMADLDLNLEFIKHAKENSLKIALSTIYWDYSYLIMTGMFSRFFGFKYSDFKYKIECILGRITSKIIKRPEYLTKQMKNKYSQIVESVDWLLPNSIEEGLKLLEYTGQTSQKYKEKIYPIVNAVDVKNFEDSFDDLRIENFVLEVGRIEPAKNQLSVVRALYNDDIPIVFLGKDYFPNSKYSKELHRLSTKRGNVHFFDQVSYEKVHTFYEKAAVHILPSLRESPGLVSLEALLNSCHIVVANENFTPVNSYFTEDMATVVNPLSIKSIREGIFREISAERNFEEIKKTIVERYSWTETSIQTYDVYKKIDV